MDQKSNIKDRRKERIRNLLEETSGTVPGTTIFRTQELSKNMKNQEKSWRELPPVEPDPELMWKERRKEWEVDGGGRRPSFAGGFIRRLFVSGILFGLAWGVFMVQRPWSLSAQDFIADSLNNEMDFQAARVWYEEHFDGAPAFIPMFNGDEQPSQKAAALHELSPPVAGNIVQPFASSLKGVEIMPAADSSGSVTVKSVDMGRVLSVTPEQQGGIRIVVRHTGDITAEYGHLSGTKLEVDDWVQSGDTVGWLLQPDSAPLPMVFFAVMKDKSYIDPADVISFD